VQTRNFYPQPHRAFVFRPGRQLRRTAYYVFALAITAILLSIAQMPALAGSYSTPAYVGGTMTGGNNPGSYGLLGGGYGGVESGGGGDNALTLSCSGAIQATFTWQAAFPGEPPPQSVLVVQTSSASAGYSNGTGTATIITTNYLGAPQYPAGPYTDGSFGAGSASTTYKVVAGASHLIITCSPSASVTETAPQIHATVSYAVSVYPIVLGQPAGTTPDSAGSSINDILIGQCCAPPAAAATIVGLPKPP